MVVKRDVYWDGDSKRILNAVAVDGDLMSIPPWLLSRSSNFTTLVADTLPSATVTAAVLIDNLYSRQARHQAIVSDLDYSR